MSEELIARVLLATEGIAEPLEAVTARYQDLKRRANELLEEAAPLLEQIKARAAVGYEDDYVKVTERESTDYLKSVVLARVVEKEGCADVCYEKVLRAPLVKSAAMTRPKLLKALEESRGDPQKIVNIK